MSHFDFFHPASGDGRGADADAASERNFLRIERNPVFVDGDAGVIESFLCLFAVETFWSEVDEHEVVVCPAGNDSEPVFGEARGEGDSV